MKRSIIFLIAVSLIINITGCSSIQKKFTRKKKSVKKAPRIYQLKKYENKPTPELYKKHYSYWVTWSSEILQTLGKNHKRDIRCIEEIVSNLTDMREMLVDDKAAKLQAHIDKYNKVRDTILQGNLSQFNKTYAMSTLEREDRAIKREFTYKHIEGSMRTSFAEEPQVADEGAVGEAEETVSNEQTGT